MRNAKITFLLIAVFAWAALPASAQLGVHVGGATSAVGQVGGAGQHAGAGLGSSLDTAVGANSDGLHRTTDGVTETTKNTAEKTSKKTKQTADKAKDKSKKTVAKTEDQADKTVDQAKSTDAGAGVQASSSTSVNAGGNSASVNSSSNTDANASGNGAAVSGSNSSSMSANSNSGDDKQKGLDRAEDRVTNPNAKQQLEKNEQKKSDSSDAKQTAKNSKGHGKK
jgi:hypothetical protein